MKIIFDSEKQKEAFFSSLGCPSDHGLAELENCEMSLACQNCWSRTIDVEVLEEGSK